MPTCYSIYFSVLQQDINEIDGSLSISAQWFYRPEEAEKEGGDPRELFYSFHIDEVPAESVMHMCVVHFIPEHKQVPSKKEHPGFIVQQVYDHREDKMYKITDKDYEDYKQHHIDLLVMKTMDRIGELPDHDREGIPGDTTYNLPRQGLRKRPLKPKDVPRDATTGISEQFRKEDTLVNDNLKNHAILDRYEVITGNQYRDWWLDKFVDTILALPHSRNVSTTCHLNFSPNVILFSGYFLAPFCLSYPHDNYSDEEIVHVQTRFEALAAEACSVSSLSCCTLLYLHWSITMQ